MNRIRILVCLVMTSSFLVQAQKQWTLQECLDYAMANNITLQQNRISSQQRNAEVEAGKAALWPSLSFSTNHNVSYRPFSESTINLTNGSMSTTSSETNYTGNYGINANWTVWNGGRNRYNIQASEMNKQLADLQTEETANSIQEQIAQLYIQILYVTEAVKVDSEMVKLSTLQRDRGLEMLKVGSMAKVDVAQLEAQVTQDKYSLVNMQSQLANYKLQLKQLLEILGPTEFEIAIPALTDQQVLTLIPDRQAVYQQALETRPEIQSSKLNIDAAKLEIKNAKAAALPTLSMSANMASNHASGINTHFDRQMKKNWSNSLSLSLSVPIFDQKQTKTNVTKAKLATRNSELQLQDTEKKLYSNIENFWLQATTSQQQFIAAKSNVENMTQSYELVSEQFRLGLKNIVELTTGKNNLLSAKQQMLQSKYMALFNMAMLRFYSGEKIKL
ncbi:MAG: TolC family protein [Bacteroidaceae bacterium]|nr:TolC family protein [Bacteroidaceae bacterium]